jgi:serine/threonine protein kinase
MALEILPTSKRQHMSPKNDVYSFGILLIQLVNGSPFILGGDKMHIHDFIKWAKKVHVKDGFQQIFYVVINNLIAGFDHNEANFFL